MRLLNGIFFRRAVESVVLLACVLSAVPARAAAPAPDYVAYTGCCDGSATAPVNEALFANASDEENVLRLYPRGTGGPPVATLSLRGFLGAHAHAEADLEGAARLGESIYWIGSHSRNSDGQLRPARHLLFATTIRGTGAAARLETSGQPFRDLAMAVAAQPSFERYRFAAGTKLAGEAPGGFNIEGLAAGPADALYVGLRNPLYQGRALVVPLLNPQAVTHEGKPAQLGPVLELDLQGLGIRDLARAGDRWLVLGGPAEKGGRHRLFLWEGGDHRPVPLPAGVVPKGFQAEGLVVDDVAGGHVAEILGDEDDLKIGGVECWKIKELAQRRFRGLRVRY